MTIEVPKDRYLLDFLAEQGEQTRDSWIFIKRELVTRFLTNECRDINFKSSIDGIPCIMVSSTATKKKSQRTIWMCNTAKLAWMMVAKIDAEDIAFKLPSDDPNEILMLKEEE